MESFKDIINGDTPVLVDFFATWCGPCKAMSPIIESLGKELQGKTRILKIDIDKNQPVAQHYQIQGVPTFIIFKKGEMLWRHSGTIDKNTIKQQLEGFIK
jgi:thioredoxin 1